MDRLTKPRLQDGVRALCHRDSHLAAVVSRFGPPPLWARRPGYATLVQIVLEQQVSLASARATFTRLEQACGAVTAERFAGLSETTIRAAGVTRQKASYCVGIARDIVDGTLCLTAVARANDETARQKLVRIRGIGPWTADIYLLMALKRPDVWPDGDLALAIAAQQVKGLQGRPDTVRLRHLAGKWSPWRAVAARILWHHYLSTRGRSTGVDFGT
ncbi:MAG: DNA-3-methyladenine glycosylase 2 family protein [Acidobacteriota bacterium]|nr:DNA-3-methyladenine glycosylase 2 family protein [Acidobacteriota bacterium]